jgi:hypothetical protein
MDESTVSRMVASARHEFSSVFVIAVFKVSSSCLEFLIELGAFVWIPIGGRIHDLG